MPTPIIILSPKGRGRSQQKSPSRPRASASASPKKLAPIEMSPLQRQPHALEQELAPASIPALCAAPGIRTPKLRDSSSWSVGITAGGSHAIEPRNSLGGSRFNAAAVGSRADQLEAMPAVSATRASVYGDIQKQYLRTKKNCQQRISSSAWNSMAEAARSARLGCADCYPKVGGFKRQGGEKEDAGAPRVSIHEAKRAEREPTVDLSALLALEQKLLQTRMTTTFDWKVGLTLGRRLHRSPLSNLQPTTTVCRGRH